jgi:hypothetical protein
LFVVTELILGNQVESGISDDTMCNLEKESEKLTLEIRQFKEIESYNVEELLVSINKNNS